MQTNDLIQALHAHIILHSRLGYDGTYTADPLLDLVESAGFVLEAQQRGIAGTVLTLRPCAKRIAVKPLSQPTLSGLRLRKKHTPQSLRDK